MTDRKCSERIEEEYQSEMETLRILWASYCNEDCPKCDNGTFCWVCGNGECLNPEEHECHHKECKYCNGTGKLDEDNPEEGNIHEHGLSFDYCYPTKEGVGYFRYQISWGGPSDEFRIYAEKRNDWSFPVWKVIYVFEDWFDHAEKRLVGDDLKLLETIFSQYFTESGTTNHVYMEAMKNWNEEEID